MKSRMTKVLLLATVILALGGVGTGVALASSDTPITSAAAPAKAHAAKAGKLRGLHGEFTTGGKTPATHVYQRGTVTAVSPTSITVSSTDGFSATYVVDAGTKVRKQKQASQIGQVAANDHVVVTGVRSGTALDAKHIRVTAK